MKIERHFHSNAEKLYEVGQSVSLRRVIECYFGQFNLEQKLDQISWTKERGISFEGWAISNLIGFKIN